MILECPSCHNRYLVDPRAVGKAGRTVRCAKCRNEWFAEPAEDAPQDDVIPAAATAPAPKPRPIPAGSSVPAIHKPRPAVPESLKIATLAMLGLFLLTALAYFRPLVVEAVPGFRGTYAALGMYDSAGIVFANLEYSHSSEVSKDRHRVAGMLVNTDREARRLPVVQISLLDKDGKLLRRSRITGEGVIAAGGQKPFVHELSASPESTRRIVLEAGSPFELKLR